jgi:hypothetical protein
MSDLLEFAMICILVLACCIGIGAGIYAIVSPPSCNAATQEIGFPHKWGFWSGCMIEVEEGQWIPLENYRYFEGE